MNLVDMVSRPFGDYALNSNKRIWFVGARINVTKVGNLTYLTCSLEFVVLMLLTP